MQALGLEALEMLFRSRSGYWASPAAAGADACGSGVPRLGSKRNPEREPAGLGLVLPATARWGIPARHWPAGLSAETDADYRLLIETE